MEDIRPARIRAADADRERVATTVQSAGAEGRLTLDEVEERLTHVYSARFTDELTALTADLPRPVPQWPGFPLSMAALRRHPALRLHLAVVVAIAVVAIVRWAVLGAGFFWPAFPMFWLAASLFIHAGVRSARERVRTPVPY
ncbi:MULTISPECIES: DUF1707 SHOCT-like domain-containing protein [unclassified Amycolatopsis]|uniref:DUF1707 SHOCT-like domain-containing protein n=1 Tax=unclassified Amycolatopsis TaxID=2618356 RepID=UPI002E0FB380|nr:MULTISPECIES: DUF1707 domain-containing protein [unclassified Amycolatopsis]WSJ76057.1 DUF1707 domain-containing protein [Amycolatopsis sp. NBC_01307]WSK80338.1 DUF1707 domain-containing protein [Amycolatopsis sp. NBC_01286]